MSNESYASENATATTTNASDVPGTKNANPNTNPRTDR